MIRIGKEFYKTTYRMTSSNLNKLSTNGSMEYATRVLLTDLMAGWEEDDEWSPFEKKSPDISVQQEDLRGIKKTRYLAI